MTKVGVSYTYPLAGSARPHAPSSVGGQAYIYDANGNVLTGGGRTYTWTPDNYPASVTANGTTETYLYDGYGERVARTSNGITTFYVAGVREEDNSGTTRALYTFGAQVIAQRSSVGVVYLHGDHLGSVGVTTDATGAVRERQFYDPWARYARVG